MVVEEVVKRSLTHKQWHDFFTGLTLSEFYAVMDAALQAQHDLDITLVCALARKLQEHAHFSDDLDLSERTVLVAKAEAMMAFAFSHLEAGPRDRLETAWASAKDECERFGYSSGTVWEVLAPHRVFRAD